MYALLLDDPLPFVVRAIAVGVLGWGAVAILTLGALGPGILGQAGRRDQAGEG